MKPKLQIALDNLTIEEALNDVYQVADVVDIIEVGTILHLSQGMLPLKILRKLYPNKELLSDLKCADAGTTLANLSLQNGADSITAICSADIETLEAMKQETDKMNKQIHIELYGEITDVQLKAWSDIGIKHTIYHRSRDAQLSGRNWANKDFEMLKRLNKHGFLPTVTGGLKIEDIKLFKDLDIYCFIAGRSIRDAENQKQAAKDFKIEIDKYFDE